MVAHASFGGCVRQNRAEQLRPPATARTNSAAASSAFYKKSDMPKWHVASNLMLIFKTVNRSRNQTATVNHVGRTCRVDAHDRRMTEEAAEFHGFHVKQ